MQVHILEPWYSVRLEYPSVQAGHRSKSPKSGFREEMSTSTDLNQVIGIAVHKERAAEVKAFFVTTMNL